MDGPPPPDDYDDDDLDEMMASAPPGYGEPSSADLEVRVAYRRPLARGTYRPEANFRVRSSLTPSLPLFDISRRWRRR